MLVYAHTICDVERRTSKDLHSPSVEGMRFQQQSSPWEHWLQVILGKRRQMSDGVYVVT